MSPTPSESKRTRFCAVLIDTKTLSFNCILPLYLLLGVDFHLCEAFFSTTISTFSPSLPMKPSILFFQVVLSSAFQTVEIHSRSSADYFFDLF